MSTLNLIFLPQEIILLIFSYANISDLLHLRQVPSKPRQLANCHMHAHFPGAGMQNDFSDNEGALHLDGLVQYNTKRSTLSDGCERD